MQSMNRLSLQKRAQILHMLVEGNSLRATARMADVSYNSVLKLVVEAGESCAKYHDTHVRGLNSRRIQCDEIWSFCHAKQKNVPTAKAAPAGAGDVWTWTSLDADSKLICNYVVGGRDTEYAIALMDDLRSRLNNRVQITTDGHRAYLEAVEGAFGGDVDYAMLVKLYGDTVEGQKRYSPAECIGCRKTAIEGAPDKAHVSTSYVERQNLTMRMSMRRFTRLTNGFSKKIENHARGVALHTMYYNYGRVHKTLRVTPAMEAGLTDHVWTLEEIAGLMDVGSVVKKRGPYKKRAA
jgi:IS1 family transposase